MQKSKSNFKNLSNLLNKLPATIPAVGAAGMLGQPQYQYGGRIKAQDGRPKYQGDERLHGVNKDAMTGMMKARMAIDSHFGNTSAKRMTSVEPRKGYTFTGEEYNPFRKRPHGVPKGATGTHYTTDRGTSVIPHLQNKGGQNLEFIDIPRESDAEAMHFNNEQDAQYFAEFYKDVAPMMYNEDKRRGYAYGGNTPVANTPEMSRRGLNDLNYDEMYFPGNGERRRNFTMEGMKDSIYYEGLDDYNNVVESGIKHPGDEDWVIDAPNVYEKRINNNSSSKRKAKKKIKSFAELLAEHNNKENTV